MNSLILVLAFIGCAVAQIGPYRPVPVTGFVPALPAGGPRKAVNILRQSQDVNIDGSYQWSFESENGISAQEQGQLKNVPGSPEPGTAAQGQYQYTGDDGQVYSVQYVADENGFQPQGPHLPTPPPIPAAIARALEYNAAHPEPEENRAFPQRRF